jgi:hypothetical protein
MMPDEVAEGLLEDVSAISSTQMLCELVVWLESQISIIDDRVAHTSFGSVEFQREKSLKHIRVAQCVAVRDRRRILSHHREDRFLSRKAEISARNRAENERIQAEAKERKQAEKLARAEALAKEQELIAERHREKLRQKDEAQARHLAAVTAAAERKKSPQQTTKEKARSEHERIVLAAAEAKRQREADKLDYLRGRDRLFIRACARYLSPSQIEAIWAEVDAADHEVAA